MNLGCDHYLEYLLKSTEQQNKWTEINVKCVIWREKGQKEVQKKLPDPNLVGKRAEHPGAQTS